MEICTGGLEIVFAEDGGSLKRGGRSSSFSDCGSK